MTFDIREHIDKLTPAEGKDRYSCPVCSGDNLTIKPSTGEYQCWNDCTCKDIRDAIAPLEGQPKATRPNSDRTWTYTNRDGNPSIRTRRTDDGQGKRRIWQEYLVDGKWLSGGKVADDLKAPLKEAIAPYLYIECQEAIARGEMVFWVEGEPCADALWALGLAATTSIGGSASYSKYGNYTDCFADAPHLIIVPDRDTGGIKYSEAVASDYPAAQWLYAFPDSPLWGRLPKDHGLDIADWIDELRAGGIGNEQIHDLIAAAIEPMRSPKQQPDGNGKFEGGKPEVTFLQQAISQLFKGHWISFGHTLYEWKDNHYAQRLDESLSPAIQRYANRFEVKKKDREGNETVTYPYAKPRVVREVLDWVKLGYAVTSDEVNPPGLNCTNGVLILEWQGKTLEPRLVEHSPDCYYLSEPRVTYDPDADPSEYERLMECLDSSSREIWERTIAASLDLETVRRHRGRAVKALLLKGDGSNGKDTLRTLVQTVLGTNTISSCSATDFKEYDGGRYFPIYSLRGKRVNWPSENADVGRIDQLRGLRAAITGDPITFERKHQEAIQEAPRAVFLFNLNESPNLVASLKATASRWGVVPFNKTYSHEPSEGELQADPRFKEDPGFLARAVATAFLNKLLVQLQAVVNEGIDYTPTQKILEEIQRESSHLLQFAADTELVADLKGTVTVKQLWEKLQQWYQDTGTLTIEIPALKNGRHWFRRMGGKKACSAKDARICSEAKMTGF